MDVANIACAFVIIIGVIIIVAVIKKAVDSVKIAEKAQMEKEFNLIKSLRNSNNPDFLIYKIRSCADDDSQILVLETCLQRLEELAEEENNDPAKFHLGRYYLELFSNDYQDQSYVDAAYKWLSQAKNSGNKEIAEKANKLYNILNKALMFNKYTAKPKNWDPNK